MNDCIEQLCILIKEERESVKNQLIKESEERKRLLHLSYIELLDSFESHLLRMQIYSMMYNTISKDSKD